VTAWLAGLDLDPEMLDLLRIGDDEMRALPLGRHGPELPQGLCQRFSGTAPLVFTRVSTHTIFSAVIRS